MKSGGAIYFNSLGNVTNCNFVNNKINNDDGIKGGAICIVGNTYDYSTVSNCNFSGNEAISGGAMSIDGPSIVINCSFINNKAVKDYSRGGAIYFGDSGSVINCNFVNNYAKYDAGAIYSQYPGTTADTCIFKSESDSTNSNVVILPPTLNVDDFATVYGSCENLTFDLKTNSGMSLGDVDISVSVYYKNNDSWFGNYSRLSGEGWTVDFPVGFYYAVFSIDYKNFEKINRTITVIPNISYYVNVTSLTTNSRTVNITAKSNIPQEGIQGELLFILPNNANITANYNADGTWWVVHTFDVCGVYEIRASYSGLSNVTINNATITINKLKTQLKVSAVTTTYNVNKNLVITLKDSNGIALRDVKVSVNMGSAKTHKTDKNGQIKIAVGSQVPKTYSVKIKFDGNANYIASSSTVKVTVKKATPKLAAKAKTFKKAVKTKKYSVTLKNNKNKVMKNTKVTLKIKGKKAITVKTNNKGVATFIVKLTKKGTLKSTVTYKGNKYYNKVTKTVNIKIK